MPKPVTPAAKSGFLWLTQFAGQGVPATQKKVVVEED